VFQRLSNILLGRVMVVGVGDTNRGDDGAGPELVRLLEEAGVETVIDAGTSPETETWRIREAKPGTVLFVDAVELGGAPGDTALLAPSDLRASGFDTHRAPLRLTMEYVRQEMGCTCWMLAVQPRNVRQQASMSDEVRGSVERLAETLIALLRLRRGGSGS
jgi:hydrogenase maturation protease HycI